VDITDTYFVQNTYYRMSDCLGHTEEDVDVKKVVDEAQEYYNAQEKREWVEWAGKILMPRLHAQMAMEKADTMRVEQEELEEMRRQDKREQQEQEQAEKEAELEEREAEYIRQVDAKEIDDERFRELVGELDMERAMAESVVEGPATMQDEEVGVRGHPSVSLLPLSSPTLHLFICIPPPHLCTIFKDHT
jgi:hypothetical protein